MGKKITKNVSKTAKAVVSTVKVAKVRKPRAVSFAIVTVNKRRTFTPVNKRAKAFAELAGATKLSVKHLKSIKALGFKVVETGTLEPISL